MKSRRRRACTCDDIVGNVYLKMVLGDSLKEAAKLPAGDIDLVLADPPYGNIVKDRYDKITPQDLVDMLLAVVEASMRLLKPGGSLILFGGVGSYKNRPLFEFLSRVENEIEGAFVRDVITWKKNRGYGTQTRYLFTREEIIWITKGKEPAFFDKPYLDEKHSAATQAMLKNAKYKTHSNHKRRSNVWADIKELMRGKVVTAQKPQKLYDVLIETHCPELGGIVDLFGGSGASAISANRLNRNILIYENDPEVYGLMRDHIRSELL
jgi:site-specific DNA-methyltransferase (adenine-specific)